MINSIIEAVSASLNEEFGDGYEIYMEEIKQDLEEPWFFVQCLNSTNELFLGKRYFRRNQFCIQYFPESAEKQRECNGVAERLWQCLEYITMYGETKPIRGTKMRYEVVDSVLNFFVNYDLFVYKVDASDAMEEISENVTMKG